MFQVCSLLFPIVLAVASGGWRVASDAWRVRPSLVTRHPSPATPTEYPRAPREEIVLAPRTVALLKEYLESDDPRERSEALGVLRQVRDPQTADAVRRLTDDPDAAVRAQALLTLAALLPESELVPILSEKAADKAKVVASQALGILGGVPGPEAFAALMQVRSTLAPESVALWVSALARREELVPAAIVLELLEAPAETIRTAAAQIVVRQPDSVALAHRLELLSDSNWQVRCRAIEALRDSKDDRQVREAVVERLNDASSLVRRSALEWLRGSPVELQVFEARLEDPDPTVRIAAVEVAGQTHGMEAVQKLIDRLSDREFIVAHAASDQLAVSGADSVAEALIGLLKDSSDQVVRLSARSLGLLKSTAAIEQLQALAEHRSELVRIAAYEAIGRIGEARVASWLLETVVKESGYPRAAINEALGRLHDRQAVDHLLAECHHPDKKSKGLDPSLFVNPMSMPGPYPVSATAAAAAAVRALGELGDARAVPVLVEVSRDVLRNEPFWTGVMSSLGKLGDDRARPALIELGVVGQISQGMMVVQLPPPTRIEALRAMATLVLTDVTDEIIATDPATCPLEVRQAAAEVLTTLTGHTYTYRLPVRQGTPFIEDRSSALDLSAFKLPICYAVDGP